MSVEGPGELPGVLGEIKTVKEYLSLRIDLGGTGGAITAKAHNCLRARLKEAMHKQAVFTGTVEWEDGGSTLRPVGMKVAGLRES